MATSWTYQPLYIFSLNDSSALKCSKRDKRPDEPPSSVLARSELRHLYIQSQDDRDQTSFRMSVEICIVSMVR